MSIQSVCWLVCLLVTLVTHSHGFQFSLTRTPNNAYCGYLQCSANISETDTYINTLLGLTISAIVHNTFLRLAYVSMLDSRPHVKSTRVLVLNETGFVTRYHGNLTIVLRHETDCQFGSFLCELTFMNSNNLPDTISEIVASERTEKCETSSNPVATMVVQMKTYSLNIERKFKNVDDKLSQLWAVNTDMDMKLTELRSQNTTTEQDLARLRDQNVAMETKLDQILEQLSWLNKEYNKSEVTCKKGAAHTRPREKITLWGRVPALCDAETDGGGWVIIQRRTHDDIDFYKNWNDYKNGFGTPDTDFWLGNDKIHNLTSQGYNNLRVDMEYQGVKYFAVYSNFSVANGNSKYQLTVSGFYGNAGDTLSSLSGMYFTTLDKDNDDNPNGNCAYSNHAAWWYKWCSNSNLNGQWGVQTDTGLFWKGVVYPGSVTWSEMKIRQV